MLALERERPRPRPGADDQVVRLLEALVRERRVDAGRVIFGADAAHEAGDDAALRQIVEHREFFGDVDRIVDQRQRAAEDRDLDPLGALDERARDQVRRRHHAVGGLMVLVDADGVEAELFGVGELIEIGLVFLRALLRIVEAVRQHHPGRAMLLALARSSGRYGMRWKQVNFMAGLPPGSRAVLAQRRPAFRCAASAHTPARSRPAHPVRALPHGGVGARQQLVVLAPDDQRRHRDAVQPAFQRRVEPARLPAQPRGHETVRHLAVRLFLGRFLRKDFVGEGLVVIEVAHRLLGPPDEIVAARHALHAHAGRRDQRQAL